MGVLESHHRKHVGQILLAEAENFLSKNNFQYLQVKTLSESRQNEEYQRTRKFYQKMGFVPVEEFKTTWLDFEEGQYLEAKFVSALDRFLPIFSNYLNDAYTWKKHNISYEQILSRNFNPISRGFAELWPIAEKMIKDALENKSNI